MKLNQNQTPFLDALIKYINEKISPFDVPGHHMGNVENKLKDFLGGKTFRSDVNAPIGLDSLPHPTGVIKQAQERKESRGLHYTIDYPNKNPL